MKKRLYCFYLDLLAAPGLFMGKVNNALWHLNHVCPKCPEVRRKLRRVNSKCCWWESHWKKGNFDIPKSFGFVNWISQYIFWKTNLIKYKEFAKDYKPKKAKIECVYREEKK